MWDEEPPADRTGPPVDVELADGQIVQAVLLQRLQERDGTWWYRLRLAGLWARQETPDGAVHAVPDDITLDAPADMVRPHPGLERAYAAVPTRRHPARLRRHHCAGRRG